MIKTTISIILLAIASLQPLAVYAAEPSAPQQGADPAAKLQAEVEAAFTAATKVKQDGPADIKLDEQATLKLPVGYLYIPKAEARQLLTSLGNRTDDTLVGMIFPATDQSNWFIVITYVSSGYIKDDDAKDWKADELLANIKEGTEHSNEDRKARGIPEMEIVGWVEKPNYDAAAHRLVWSLSSKDKGAPDTEEKGINYNTYALGREGYISMNLVTDLRSIEAQKPIAKDMLAALNFNEGRRYADFNESTDKVAEYGLAALVGGVAAKKLGLLAVIGAFIAKFFKIIIAVGIGGIAVIGKFFKGKKDGAA